VLSAIYTASLIFHDINSGIISFLALFSTSPCQLNVIARQHGRHDFLFFIYFEKTITYIQKLPRQCPSGPDFFVVKNNSKYKKKRPRQCPSGPLQHILINILFYQSSLPAILNIYLNLNLTVCYYYFVHLLLFFFLTHLFLNKCRNVVYEVTDTQIFFLLALRAL
jgi:hypothetical protein